MRNATRDERDGRVGAKANVVVDFLVEWKNGEEVIGDLFRLLLLLLLPLVLLLLARRLFRCARSVFVSDFLEFLSAVAIIFIHIEDVVYLVFYLVR